MKISNIFKSLKNKHLSIKNLNRKADNTAASSLADILTSKIDAVEEIKKRRLDTVLLNNINEYLKADLPKHFVGTEPILYLSRHIATPNLETLKFIEVAKELKLPIVIGEDRKGKFVSINPDKKSLGKMQIVKGINRRQDEIVENFTLFDFKKFDGEKFFAIETYFNESLIDFHHTIFKEIYPDIKIFDESEWVDRNFRNDISEQYKRFLTLMIAHGIMFEVYYPGDDDFVYEIILPAFDFVSKKFGVKPLICNIFPEDFKDNEADWIKYPSVLYPIVSSKF